MSDRDPRLEPRPGDVLKNGERRTIRKSGWPTHLVSWRMPGYGNRVFTETLEYFRKWAAGATVIKRGEE